ncbi:phosphate/phosphite/phosphonate ABC transporter substrate-binding protein [Magnetovirga frankeli]|uniref:phosphate/phosphite/phosphonate ABC transporter substrate-binding protein n=1 Tax=Magnetovirga frankeli TaxID=947516 RepID=UPI001293ED64|nr:phosphate/phosphite/phosphonate ABC transporter substrate-binding protein [gamma proteobacterium SS-5]
MKLACLLLFGLSLLVSPLYAAGQQPGDGEQAFVFGVVPQFEVRKLHAIWRPILDRLQEKTGYRFALRGSASIPEFEQEFIQGRFDFAYMNPYHLVVANQKAGYIPLARDQGRQLFGVLVVRQDSAIQSPAELDGQVVAFPAPNALGASLQMRQELADRFGTTVIPSYVKTHDSVYLNVLLGKAAAGGGVQKTLNQQRPEYRDNLRIIHQTEKVAPHPLAALPRVPEEVRQRVTQALLEMGQSPPDQALLARIPMARIGKAELADYQPLLKMDLQRFYQGP